MTLAEFAEKLIEIAENVSKVFKAGKKSQYDEFWDDFQQNGNRTNYTGAFGSQWTTQTFKPKYPIRPTNANFMFYDNSGGKIIIPDFVEYCEENNVVLDFSNCTVASYGIGCLHSNHYGVLDFSKCTTLASLFYLHNCATGVKKIDKFKVTEATTFNVSKNTAGTFYQATYLTDITIDGNIGKSIDFSQCTNLSRASIESVISALSSNVSGQTASFSKAAIYKVFTETAWEDLIAPITNWNISEV